MTRSSNGPQAIFANTAKGHCADIGAKSPVPLITPYRDGDMAMMISSLSCLALPMATGGQGFQLVGAQSQTDLARCKNIARRSVQLWNHPTNRETELNPMGREGL